MKGNELEQEQKEKDKEVAMLKRMKQEQGSTRQEAGKK